MRALQRTQDGVHLLRLPSPQPGPGQARLKVRYAGLCRTDIYVAQGKLPSPTPITLGHEFSGYIDALGQPHPTLKPGQAVGVMPLLRCGKCEHCLNGGASHLCPAPSMLGVDLDGAFADEVIVPIENLYALPQGMDMRVAAYLEPIAASLAVLQAPISPQQRGVILGDSRIAELTARVLLAHGFEQLERWAEPPSSPPSRGFDFAIETFASAQNMSALIDAVRPEGVIILKSRPTAPIALDWRALLAKSLTLKAAYYAPFSQALALAQRPDFDISDLLGACYALEDYEQVLFGQEHLHSRAKIFFDMER